MSQPPQYTIQPITENYYEEVINFLKRTFYTDEPLNHTVGLCSNNTPCTYLDDYCNKGLRQGISFRAADDDGNTVGCVINGIDKKHGGEDLLSQAKECKDRKFQKILYVLAIRNQNCKLWDKFPDEDRVIDMKVVSTDPRWRKRGIMNLLVKETEKKAKELRVNLVRMDTSSAYSAKCAESCGFTLVYKAAFTDVKLDGQPIIVPEEPHIYDKVYIKSVV